MLDLSTEDRELAIRGGNAQTQLKIARLFKTKHLLHRVRGRPEQCYLAMAMKWLQKAADQNLADAQWELGRMYEKSNYERKTHSDEIQWRLAIACGGEGGDEDGTTRAIKWYRMAAEQGHNDAQYSLAELLLRMNDRNALKWYKTAAGQGNENAQTRLAQLYEENHAWKVKWLVKDDRLAMKWYKVAAEQGSARAQHKLGEMYETGRGISRRKRNFDDLRGTPACGKERIMDDCTNPLTWYRRAAEQDDNDAIRRIGDAYENGELGLIRDISTAMECWLKSATSGYYDEHSAERIKEFADQGNAMAQFLMGRLEESRHEEMMEPFGDTLPFVWYQRAASQGYLKAQLHLAVMYEEGEVIPRNQSSSFEWYLKAAQQGHTSSQLRVALMYEKGQGVTLNESAASEWYQRAASRGNPDSIFVILARNKNR